MPLVTYKSHPWVAFFTKNKNHAMKTDPLRKIHTSISWSMVWIIRSKMLVFSASNDFHCLRHLYMKQAATGRPFEGSRRWAIHLISKFSNSCYKNISLKKYIDQQKQISVHVIYFWNYVETSTHHGSFRILDPLYLLLLLLYKGDRGTHRCKYQRFYL